MEFQKDEITASTTNSANLKTRAVIFETKERFENKSSEKITPISEIVEMQVVKNEIISNGTRRPGSDIETCGVIFEVKEILEKEKLPAIEFGINSNSTNAIRDSTSITKPKIQPKFNSMTFHEIYEILDKAYRKQRLPFKSISSIGSLHSNWNSDLKIKCVSVEKLKYSQFSNTEDGLKDEAQILRFESKVQPSGHSEQKKSNIQDAMSISKGYIECIAAVKYNENVLNTEITSLFPKKIQKKKQAPEFRPKLIIQKLSGIDLKSIGKPKSIDPKWTKDEELMTVDCFKKFGKDFNVISRFLGNKTPENVASFFKDNRIRLNLEKEIKKFEAKRVKIDKQREIRNNAKNLILGFVQRKSKYSDGSADIKFATSKYGSDDTSVTTSKDGSTDANVTSIKNVAKINRGAIPKRYVVNFKDIK